MEPAFLAVRVLWFVGLVLALAVIPLAARRAGPAAWAALALGVALCSVALVVVTGHWIYAGMVSWWRVGAFWLVQLVVPTAVAAWAARAAAGRWPARRWEVATTVVILVFAVATAVGARVYPLPDIVTAVQ